MKIISRYILKAHIGPFLFGTCTVLFLFLFNFLLQKLNHLVGKGLDTWIIVQLIGLSLAYMIVLAVPLGVLFSTLMAFGNLSSTHETTIVKASGGSLLRMMAPVIVIGMMLTMSLFWFNDVILPEANHKLKTMMLDIKRKKPTFTIESGRFVTELEGYTLLARHVDSLSQTMRGVTIYDNRRSDKSNVVNADSGIIYFSPDQTRLIMDLYHGEIHQLEPTKSGQYRIVDFDKYRFLIKTSGFAFTHTDQEMISRGDREMHISDMQQLVDEAKQKIHVNDSIISGELAKHKQYLDGLFYEFSLDTTTTKKLSSNDTSEAANLRKVKRRVAFLKSSIYSKHQRMDNYDYQKRKYQVEIHKKYAIPFACIAFLLVGCPLGMRTRRGDFGISAIISLGFFILYWACLIGGEKLADRGYLEPWLSMWLGDILVGTMGLWLTFRVNSETSGNPVSWLISKFRR